jgi:hypothetical protein
MPRVGFETTTPLFEVEKAVHALDRAATVFGYKPPSLRFNKARTVTFYGDWGWKYSYKCKHS